MRRSWALAWCALAACSSHGGAEIVVMSPSGAPIDQIALYVGVGHAASDAIGPMGYNAPIGDKMMWWGRDANGRDVAKKVGAQVTFEYEASSGSGDQLGVIVAVAFDQGVPVAAAYQQAVEVPVGSIAKYTLDLQPVSDPTRNAGLGLEVWGPPGDATACVWVDDPSTATELMVVDGSDPDCDGVTMNECDDRVYLAHRGPSIQTDNNHIHCDAQEMIVNAGGTAIASCVLGGDLCVDGAGWSPACVNSVYCVPQSDCAACNQVPDPFGCLADMYHSGMPSVTTYTSIDCPLQLDATGALCVNTVMFDATTLAANYGRTCRSDPLLFDVASGKWNDKTTVRGIQISVANAMPSCSFTLQLSGSGGFNTPPSVLIAADLDNGRGLAIPITFHVSTDCTAALMCQFNGAAGAFGTVGDNFVPDCVNAPPNYPP